MSVSPAGTSVQHTHFTLDALIEMAKRFQAATHRDEALSLSKDELKFYDALATNEPAVRKIAHELTEHLWQNLTVDWSERESVRA